MTLPKIEKEKDPNLKSFLEEYGIICKRYGLMVAGQIRYKPSGITVEPIIVSTNENAS